MSSSTTKKLPATPVSYASSRAIQHTDAMRRTSIVPENRPGKSSRKIRRQVGLKSRSGKPKLRRLPNHHHLTESPSVEVSVDKMDPATPARSETEALEAGKDEDTTLTETPEKGPENKKAGWSDCLFGVDKMDPATPARSETEALELGKDEDTTLPETAEKGPESEKANWFGLFGAVKMDPAMPARSETEALELGKDEDTTVPETPEKGPESEKAGWFDVPFGVDKMDPATPARSETEALEVGKDEDPTLPATAEKGPESEKANWFGLFGAVKMDPATPARFETEALEVEKDEDTTVPETPEKGPENKKAGWSDCLFGAVKMDPATPARSEAKALEVGKYEDTTFPETPEKGPENMKAGWFHGQFGAVKMDPATPARSEAEALELGKDEDTTLPETPEKGRISQISSTDSEDEMDEVASSSKKSVHFALLLAFLLAAIAGLSYVVWYLHDRNGSANVSPGEVAFAVEPTLPPTTRPSEAPSVTPTVSSSPTIHTARPTSQPTRRLSRPPTSIPTRNPTPYPTVETEESYFMELMARTSPTVAMAIENTNSNHYRAFRWLTNDPDFYSYDDERLITRWVLAFFKLEVRILRRPPTSEPTPLPSSEPTPLPSTDSSSGLATTSLPTVDPFPDRRLNWNSMESWMQYTDECQWFTSFYFNNVACNSKKEFKRFVLINLGLEGTLPKELTLLSKLGKEHANTPHHIKKYL
jgi:hypothetical protein